MRRLYVNPPESPSPRGYHHMVSVEGGRTIYLAGQVAFDKDRNIVGGDDVTAQARQALRNLERAVKAGGGQLSDMVKITTFVVDYKQEQVMDIVNVIREFFPADRAPANSLIGVQALAMDGLLIEIEGIAVTDAPMP